MPVNSIRSSTVPFQAVSIRPIPDQPAGDTKKAGRSRYKPFPQRQRVAQC